MERSKNISRVFYIHIPEMKNSLLLFFFLPLLAFTQHCPYDYESVIVLDIRCDNSKATIEGLKITLQNAAGNIIMTSVYNGKEWTTDTSFFWLNTDTTTYTGIIDNEHAWRPWRTHFWFAKDNYVLVCPRTSSYKGWKMRIEDVDGKSNCGRFQSATVAVTNEFVYPLCSAFSFWDMGEKYGFVKDYKPKRVELVRK